MDDFDMAMAMSMSSDSSMFQETNIDLALVYWYLIAGVLALLLLVRTTNYAQRWLT
jgi:hypothetical protein